jgi:hypothetical protein
MDVISIMKNPLIEPFPLNAINHWHPSTLSSAIEALKTRDARFTLATLKQTPET